MTVVRIVTGLVVAVIGAIAMVFGLLGFNNLFFENQLLSLKDVPLYGRQVVLPLLAGLLLLIDGFVILGLRRIFSLGPHILANAVWIYAAYSLHQSLQVPVLRLADYQQTFIAFLAALVIFVLGAVINHIPSRPQA